MTGARFEERLKPEARSAAGTADSFLKSVWSIARRDAVLIVAIAVIVTLGVFRLGSYPSTWFDEGMYLQTAKNLATTHTYAVRSADGTLDYAPSVGVGPTVILPVAGAFLIGPVTLETARLISLIYLLIATVLVYLIARALFGQLASALALLFLAGLPALDWVATGRQMLGEVPAVTFLLAGGLVAYGTRARWNVATAGILLGLAMVTKGQYVPIIPATIVVLALADRLWIHRRGLRWFAELLAVVLGTYALWIVSLLLIIGGRDISASYRQLRGSSEGALLVFNLSRMEAAARLLLGPSTLLFALPAVIAGLWWILDSHGERQERILALWTFQCVWFGWFIFASIGWARYAFPALTISTIFMGALSASLINYVRNMNGRRYTTSPTRVVAAGATVAVVLVLFAGVWHELSPITRSGNSSAQTFARAVAGTTDPGATIDGWEPEVGFFLNRKIQYPPVSTLHEVVNEKWASNATSVDLSPELHGDYLIVGPFARWVGVYSRAIDDGTYQPVLQVGDYELLKRTPSGNAVENNRGYQ